MTKDPRTSGGLHYTLRDIHAVVGFSRTPKPKTNFAPILAVLTTERFCVRLDEVGDLVGNYLVQEFPTVATCEFDVVGDSVRTNLPPCVDTPREEEHRRLGKLDAVEVLRLGD